MEHRILIALFLVVFSVSIKFTNAVSIEEDLSMTLRVKQTLDKFRERVQTLLKDPYMRTDIFLIRWLRARNFNLDAAEDMLKQNLRWRKETNMDNILQENFDDISRDFPATIDTYDKMSRPIGVIDIYEWDVRGAILQGRGQRLLRYMDYLLENITTQVFERQAKGMNVTQWKVLANCDGFNLVTHGCPVCLPLWIQFVNSLVNHFPGWLDELIAVDSVNIIVEILRPVLSTNTRQAIKVFSAIRAKWMKYLDERISRTERRPAYGGTKPPVIF